MSMLTGKCDFYDSFMMIHGECNTEKALENIKKLELYVPGSDGRDHLVKTETLLDVAKYFPYIISHGCFSSDAFVIYLSSTSYIDVMENERIKLYVDDIMRYWKKCKRQKKAFVVEECIGNQTTYNYDIKLLIANKVQKDGDKAIFDDIHLPTYEHARKEWFKTLVEFGSSEYKAWCWCFNEFTLNQDYIKKRLGRAIKI